MQETNNNKSENTFDDVIKEKLAHYLLPLNNGVWEKIEKRLNEKPEKKVLWTWISSVAAVAAIVLGWLIFMYNNKTVEYGTREQLSDHEEKVTKEIPDEENLPAVLSSSHRDQRIVHLWKTGKETVETESVPEFDVIEVRDSAIDRVRDLPVAERQPYREGLLDKLPPDLPDTLAYVILAEKKASMAFYIGSGGTLPAMNDQPSGSSGFFSYNDAAKVSNAPFLLRSEVFTEKAFSYVRHYPPLSFGVTFKKELNSRLAVESGLVYTFLTSRFENKNPDKDATLKLHYLGVPFNLHTSLIGNRWNKWGLYLSLGLMSEKGLRADYSLNEYSGNFERKASFSRKIKGWQWSLNGSFGIEYELINNYGIYLEPKVSYYFKNNQPESARTENPLIIGVNAGVRYTW